MTKLIVSYFHFFMIISFDYNFFQAIHASDATFKKQSGFRLKMIHWNSPELPSHRPNLTHNEIMNELARISVVRLKTLEQLAVYNNSLSSNGVIRPRMIPVISHSVYLVQVGIGTFQTQPPFKTYYLLLDTTTDYTWTQCEGCNPCFPQRDPYFPWRQSHTYLSMQCTHCPTACHHGHCMVNLTLGAGETGDYISGAMTKDDFKFQTQDDLVVLPQVDFICAFSSHGFMGGNLPQDNVASGVLGLGRGGYRNLMRGVTDANIKTGRFSYCLLPPNEPIQHPMYLRFGRDIPLQKGRRIRVATTPILRPHNPRGRSFYYLDLLDLAVGGRKLGIDPQVFSIHPDGSGGCIIDSACPFSYISRVAYDHLEHALTQHFEAINHGRVRRVDSPFSIFPVCYEQTTPQFPTYPTVTFHFASLTIASRADLDVSKAMGNHTHNGRQLHCLQILSSDGATTVLGAMQQLNHRFVYDITKHSRLQIYKENCEESN